MKIKKDLRIMKILQFVLGSCASPARCLSLVLQLAIITPAMASDYRDITSFTEVQADLKNQIEEHGASRVLVVFDMDSSLLKLKEGIGSKQWLDWQNHLLTKLKVCQQRYRRFDISAASECLATYKQKGLVAKSFVALIKAQGLIFENAGTQPIDPILPARIKKLQAAGIPVIAVTSRLPQNSKATQLILNSNGYHFQTRSPKLQDQVLTTTPDLFSNINRPLKKYGYSVSEGVKIQKENALLFGAATSLLPVLFQKGIFYTSAHNKGVMLRVLHHYLKVKPKAIFYIDSELAQTESVWASFFGKPYVRDIFVYKYTAIDLPRKTPSLKDKAIVSSTWTQLFNELKILSPKKNTYSDFL